MKQSRTLAASAAIALLAVTAALGAAPASAAPGDVYVAASSLAPTQDPPQPGWSYAGTATAPAGRPSGLTVAASSRLVLGLGTAAAGATLAGLGDTVQIDAATEGAAVDFGIGLLPDPADPAGYTEISSDALGAAAFDPDATWTGTFFAGSLTLAQIDALSPGLLVTAVSFGGAADDFAVARFAANGVVYAFTPVPTAVVTPATLTPLALGTTGVTATFTGLLPGAQVFAFFTPDSGDPDDAVLIDQDFTADAAGSVTVPYIAAATTFAVGSYSIVVGDGLDVVTASFAVVAAVVPVAPAPPAASAPAAAAAAPVLAATGAEAGAGVLLAGMLLLAGAGLAALGARRRSGTRA